jgi:hypothetical protein
VPFNLSLARVQAQGKNSGPASKARYFVLYAFAHERGILMGSLLLDYIFVIHHKGSRYAQNSKIDHFFRLKMEQEQTVYCLLEGRDIFAVMPMGIACREVLE